MDDTLKESGAAVMEDNSPKVVYNGLRNESFPPVFKPLKHSPTIEVTYEDRIEHDDIKLHPDTKETI